MLHRETKTCECVFEHVCVRVCACVCVCVHAVCCVRWWVCVGRAYRNGGRRDEGEWARRWSLWQSGGEGPGRQVLRLPRGVPLQDCRSFPPSPPPPPPPELAMS
jgi:hypothetical protein